MRWPAARPDRAVTVRAVTARVMTAQQEGCPVPAETWLPVSRPARIPRLDPRDGHPSQAQAAPRAGPVAIPPVDRHPAETPVRRPAGVAGGTARTARQAARSDHRPAPSAEALQACLRVGHRASEHRTPSSPPRYHPLLCPRLSRHPHPAGAWTGMAVPGHRPRREPSHNVRMIHGRADCPIPAPPSTTCGGTTATRSSTG